MTTLIQQPTPTERVTLDLTKNPKQADYFRKIISAAYGRIPIKYFGYGGAIRGGKTFITLGGLIRLSNIFPGSKWHVIRQDFPVLQSTTIPSFEKLIYGSPHWVASRDKSNYHFTNLETRSKIFFKGENLKNDPDLIDFLGLETNGFFLEQAEELSLKMWDMAIQRSGSWYIDNMPPAFIFLTFNPTQTWVKDKFYVPWVRGKLKPPFFFESALPNDNYFVTEDQWDSWLRMADRYYKQFIEGDWTDFADKNALWAFAFDRKKHVGKCEINFKHTVWLSFDFNRNPICCTIIQHYNNTIYIPYCIKLESSNIYALCDYIKSAIPGMNRAIFMVTGDQTGENSSALVQDNLNYYKVIQQKLNLSDNQFRVPSVNPRLADNQVLTNSLLSNYNWVIDEKNAVGVIFDMENVKMLPDGTIDKAKGDRKDPTKQADALDTVRYYANIEFSWFLDFKDTVPVAIQPVIDRPADEEDDTIMPREIKFEEKIILLLSRGEHIDCTREQWEASVRNHVLKQISFWIDTKDVARAQIGLAEIKRMDKLFS